jgi:predicted DNA binding protein
MLYSVVKSKLSPRLLETYYTWLDYQHRRSTLEALRDWLLVYSRHKVQAQGDVEGVLKNDQERRPNRRNNTYASAQNNRKTTSICFKYNKKHYISNCYRFKSMSLKARWELV